MIYSCNNVQSSIVFRAFKRMSIRTISTIFQHEILSGFDINTTNTTSLLNAWVSKVYVIKITSGTCMYVCEIHLLLGRAKKARRRVVKTSYKRARLIARKQRRGRWTYSVTLSSGGIMRPGIKIFLWSTPFDCNSYNKETNNYLQHSLATLFAPMRLLKIFKDII